MNRLFKSLMTLLMTVLVVVTMLPLQANVVTVKAEESGKHIHDGIEYIGLTNANFYDYFEEDTRGDTHVKQFAKEYKEAKEQDSSFKAFEDEHTYYFYLEEDLTIDKGIVLFKSSNLHTWDYSLKICLNNHKWITDVWGPAFQVENHLLSITDHDGHTNGAVINNHYLDKGSSVETGSGIIFMGNSSTPNTDRAALELKNISIIASRIELDIQECINPRIAGGIVNIDNVVFGDESINDSTTRKSVTINSGHEVNISNSVINGTFETKSPKQININNVKISNSSAQTTSLRAVDKMTITNLETDSAVYFTAYDSDTILNVNGLRINTSKGYRVNSWTSPSAIYLYNFSNATISNLQVNAKSEDISLARISRSTINFNEISANLNSNYALHIEDGSKVTFNKPIQVINSKADSATFRLKYDIDDSVYYNLPEIHLSNSDDSIYTIKCLMDEEEVEQFIEKYERYSSYYDELYITSAFTDENSSKKLKFIDIPEGFDQKYGEGAIGLEHFAISKQPTLEDKSVELNNNKHTKFQWYSALKTTDELTATNEKVTAVDKHEIYSEMFQEIVPEGETLRAGSFNETTKEWSPSSVSLEEGLLDVYFIADFKKGDKLTATITDVVPEETEVVYLYVYDALSGGQDIIFVTSDFNSPIESTIPADGQYLVMIGVTADYEKLATVKAKFQIEGIEIYDPIVGQNTNTFTGDEGAICLVSWYSDDSDNARLLYSEYSDPIVFPIVNVPTINEFPGVATLKRNSAKKIEKLYFARIDEDPSSLGYEVSDLTTYSKFTAAVGDNKITHIDNPADDYSIQMSEEGYYIFRIKYTDKNNKAGQYVSYVIHVDRTLVAPEVVKENGYAKLNLNDYSSVEKFYYGATTKTNVTKNYDSYENACKDLLSLKVIKNITDNSTSVPLTKVGNYIFRTKYTNALGEALYNYQEIKVTKDDLYKENPNFDLNQNVVGTSFKYYNVKEVVVKDLNGDTVEPELISGINTKSVTVLLNKGIYDVTVVDEYDRSYTSRINVNVEQDTTNNVRDLIKAIEDTEEFLNNIVKQDSGILIKEGTQVSRHIYTEDWNELNTVYQDAVKFRGTPSKWTQEKLVSRTVALRNALVLAKTKVIDGCVTVEGNTVKLDVNMLSESDGNFVYAYVSPGIHLNYTTMYATNFYKKLKAVEGTEFVAYSGLEDGVYTVRTKCNDSSGNINYRYIYVLVETNDYSDHPSVLVDNVADEMVIGAWALLEPTIDPERNVDPWAATNLIDVYEDGDQFKTHKSVVALITNIEAVKGNVSGLYNDNEDVLVKSLVELRDSMNEMPRISRTDNGKIARIFDINDQRFEYTQSIIAKEPIVVRAMEGYSYVDITFSAQNIMHYDVAFGELSEYNQFIINHKRVSNPDNFKYTAEANGVYTVRIKWFDGKYTYQTFVVENIIEPISLSQDGSDIKFKADEGYYITEIKSKFLGNNANTSVDFIAEYSGNGVEEIELSSYGIGLHVYQILYKKVGDNNPHTLTVQIDVKPIVDEETLEELEAEPVVKINDEVIGVFDYSNEGSKASSVKYVVQPTDSLSKGFETIDEAILSGYTPTITVLNNTLTLRTFAEGVYTFFLSTGKVIVEIIRSIN